MTLSNRKKESVEAGGEVNGGVGLDCTSLDTGVLLLLPAEPVPVAASRRCTKVQFTFEHFLFLNEYRHNIG